MRAEGTAPTAAVAARRRATTGSYEIIVADGAYGRTSNATVGDMQTGSTIHAESDERTDAVEGVVPPLSETEP